MVGKVFDAALTRLSAGDISGKRYLLGVSGGTDSIVMAELFYRHLPELTFAVAHVNFNLRGRRVMGIWCLSGDGRRRGMSLFTPFHSIH